MNYRRVKYFLAAIPAFYLPACYIMAVFWSIIAILMGYDITPQEGSALGWFGELGIYGTLIQWPIYFAWVLFSSELTVRLKVVWSILLLLLNMFAIPYLLICKYRRRTREDLLNLFRKQHVKQWLAKNSKIA